MHSSAVVRLPALSVIMLAMAGCSSAVGVTAAPSAQDPACAQVILALPDSLGDGLDRVETTSQATAAWGTANEAVILRCGVEPPGPTTEQCVTLETDSGASVDWLVETDSVPADETSDDPSASADPELNPGASDWTFLTYGRDPAIEVLVPAAIAAERSTAFMDALVPAVSLIPADQTCL